MGQGLSEEAWSYWEGAVPLSQEKMCSLERSHGLAGADVCTVRTLVWPGPCLWEQVGRGLVVVPLEALLLQQMSGHT